MRNPKKIATATATATTVLAATSIAMATPTAQELPGPTGLLAGEVDHMPAGAGPGDGWTDEMHADDVGWMAEMHVDGWMDGDMDGQPGAMHGDAEQMARHHAQMTERDPQLRQRHDEMVDRYPGGARTHGSGRAVPPTGALTGEPTHAEWSEELRGDHQ